MKNVSILMSMKSTNPFTKIADVSSGTKGQMLKTSSVRGGGFTVLRTHIAWRLDGNAKLTWMSMQDGGGKGGHRTKFIHKIIYYKRTNLLINIANSSYKWTVAQSGKNIWT